MICEGWGLGDANEGRRMKNEGQSVNFALLPVVCMCVEEWGRGGILINLLCVPVIYGILN